MKLDEYGYGEDLGGVEGKRKSMIKIYCRQKKLIKLEKKKESPLSFEDNRKALRAVMYAETHTLTQENKTNSPSPTTSP